MGRQPSSVVLTRQNLPTLDRNRYAPAAGLKKGAYVIAGASEDPEVILMASGSEVALMLEAHAVLESEGVDVRSVSVPCMELFKQQSPEYVRSVFPNHCRARVSIEAASQDSWDRLIGLDGEHIGVETFGASAPGAELMKEMGFTVESVVAAARRSMRRQPVRMPSYGTMYKKRLMSSDSVETTESTPDP